MTKYVLGAEALNRKIEVECRALLYEAGYLPGGCCFSSILVAMTEVKANSLGFTFIKDKASYPK